MGSTNLALERTWRLVVALPDSPEQHHQSLTSPERRTLRVPNADGGTPEKDLLSSTTPMARPALEPTSIKHMSEVTEYENLIPTPGAPH